MNEKKTSSLRLDEQVYLTMGILAMAALLIFGFRFIGSHKCAPITMSILASSFEKGNLINFKAETVGGKNFSWNFGDGSPVVEETDATTAHKYDHPGKYTVSVTVDNDCTELQNVVITEEVAVTNLALQPSFSGPDEAYVNQPITYQEYSSTSNAWAWYFEDSINVDANTKSATHVYKTPGVKKILLMINGRKDLVTYRFVNIVDKDAEKKNDKVKTDNKPKSEPRVIVVNAKPTTEPLANQQQQPADNNAAIKKADEERQKPKAPEISGIDMANQLKLVVKGAKQTQDFAPYLCNNLSLSVVYNNNNTTFAAMCENLKKLKEKKVKNISVTLFKDASTNCVSSMIVNVDMKKGFLGL